MNILFIYPNTNSFYPNAYPFGLASVVSVAKSNSHDVKVLVIEKIEDYKKIFDTVNSFGPSLIGFSSVSSQFRHVREIAKEIRTRFPGIIMVCGGAHPTISPECLKEAPSLDGVFVGESEFSFKEFLIKVERGESYKDTDNFAYLDKEGNLIVNRLKPLITNLDELPYPDRATHLFNDIITRTGQAQFYFTRGCPYSCSYCANHAVAKRYGLKANWPRYRSPESCIVEIEEVIKRYPLTYVGVNDDIFGFDEKWREEFCEKYRKRIKVKFGCLLRVNLVDEKFIKMLKESGCCVVLMGVESGNEYIRNTIMNRRISIKQIVDAFDLAHKYGLQTGAINIIGVPGETEKMIWDTIKLNRRIRPTHSTAWIFYPYKGTVLGDYCFKAGLVDQSAYYDFYNERRESVLNYPENFKNKLVYYSKNWPNLVYPLSYIKNRLRSILGQTPFWRYAKTIKKIFFHSGSLTK